MSISIGVYWKHHPEVYGGYEGCSSELGYYPCPQDAHGLEDEEGLFASMFPYKWDGAECVPTGYTMENQTFWVLWGDPSDKHELNKRTGYVDFHHWYCDQILHIV